MASGAGRRCLTEKERRVAGFDLKLSYVPLRNNQFQRLDWGTEVLYSDSRYLFDPDGIPGEAATSITATSARSASTPT